MPRPLGVGVMANRKLLVSAALVLSVFTVWLVIYSGNNEPFYGSASNLELLSQVGGGVTLAVLWLQWSIWLIWGVNTNRLLLLWLFWSVGGLLLSIFCAWGYANDIYVSTNNLIP